MSFSKADNLFWSLLSVTKISYLLQQIETHSNAKEVNLDGDLRDLLDPVSRTLSCDRVPALPGPWSPSRRSRHPADVVHSDQETYATLKIGGVFRLFSYISYF